MLRTLLLLTLLATSAASAQPRRVVVWEDSIAVLGTMLDTTQSDETTTQLRDLREAARDSLAVAEARVRPGGDVAAAGTDVVPRAAEPDRPWYAQWWVWAILGVILVTAAVVALWIRSRPVRAIEPVRRTLVVPTGAERTARDQAAGVAAPFATTQQIDTLRKIAQQNQEQIARLEQRLDRFEQQQARLAAPAPVAPVAAAPAIVPSPVDAAAQAFVAWCRQGTPLMNRVDFFEKHLRTAQPEASARAVFRDSYAQAATVRFDAQGGAAPAEFWLVTVGPDTVVFPQPLGAQQFRDLAPVFDGTATPQTVQAVTPARVRDEGGAVVLSAPGRVS